MTTLVPLTHRAQATGNAFIQGLFRTRYEWLRCALTRVWIGLWKAVCTCRTKERLEMLAAEEFEDDVREAGELKDRENKKQALRKRKKSGGEYYRCDGEEDSPSIPDEYEDATPQYPPWVWQAIGMEDPLSLYAAQPTLERGFYVDPASMGKMRGRLWNCESPCGSGRVEFGDLHYWNELSP